MSTRDRNTKKPRNMCSRPRRISKGRHWKNLNTGPGIGSISKRNNNPHPDTYSDLSIRHAPETRFDDAGNQVGNSVPEVPSPGTSNILMYNRQSNHIINMKCRLVSGGVRSMLYYHDRDDFFPPLSACKRPRLPLAITGSISQGQAARIVLF